MALSRKLLQGMGLEEAQIESIIEGHQDTIAGLKEERDELKGKLEHMAEVEKELAEAKQTISTYDGDEWHGKYDAEHKAFEDFKIKVESEKADRAKADAYRAMLKEAGIDPARIDTIMRVTDLGAVEMDGDTLKDLDELAEGAKKEWADFVVKTRTEGAAPATPPKNTGGDGGGDPEIKAHIQARHERLYGKSE